MSIFDKFRRKKKEREEDIQKTEVNTPQKTKETIKRTEDKRIEKTKILEGYKVKDASTHNWQDESSHEVEARLKKNGIQLPWHYNDTFGENFKVLALRAGGVGAVFFVKSTRFGERIYAAKTLQRFLQKDYLEMPTYQQKKIADDFLEEALPWLEMGQHPNIVPVHRLENIVHPTTKRIVPFVFSEFMEKGDLKNLLLEKGRFDLEEAISAGLQVCEALIHAYKHGLSAHKDLKPDNIMIYREGVYKVTDFSAGVLGTPGYMAPEQVASRFKLKDNIAIDQRADQFALGLIMLEFILGKHPFPWIIGAAYSKEEAKKFLRVGAGEIPDNLPDSLRGIIAKCLSPDPANRFSGLSALKDTLLEVYRTELGEYQFPEVEIDDSPEWWFNRGAAFCLLERYADAKTPFKKALRMYKAKPGTEIEQAICFMFLGTIHHNIGELHKAEDSFKEALKMLKAKPDEIQLAACFSGLGNIYVTVRKFYEAEDYFKEALRLYKIKPEREIEQALSLMNLGDVYYYTNRPNEAEGKYKEALRTLKAKSGTEKEQGLCLLKLGNVCEGTNRLYDAKDNYEEALKMLEAIPGTEVNQAGCIMNVGNVYRGIGRPHKAEENYEKALRMFKTIQGTNMEQAACFASLGNVRHIIGKFPEAEDNYKEALRIFKAVRGMEIEQARCLTNWGISYINIQEFSKARSVLKDALDICERYPMGTEHIKNACLQFLSQLP